MSLKYEWDDTKAISNLKKHGVTFEEVRTVFSDTLSKTIPDPLHPGQEARFVTLGMSDQARFLVVVHTDDVECIRLISARRATIHERKRYEEGDD